MVCVMVVYEECVWEFECVLVCVEDVLEEVMSEMEMKEWMWRDGVERLVRRYEVLVWWVEEIECVVRCEWEECVMYKMECESFR